MTHTVEAFNNFKQFSGGNYIIIYYIHLYATLCMGIIIIIL